jgi:hypothetical protein
MVAPTRSPGPWKPAVGRTCACAGPADAGPGGNSERAQGATSGLSAPKLAGSRKLASAHVTVAGRANWRIYVCLCVRIYTLCSLQHSSSWQTWLAEAPGAAYGQWQGSDSSERGFSRISQWFSEARREWHTKPAESRPHPSAQAFTGTAHAHSWWGCGRGTSIVPVKMGGRAVC